MIRSTIFLFFFLAVAFTRALPAQGLAGSTTIDVDPSTNIVTATCDTDIDDGDYEAEVQCMITDGANNVIAQQGDVDHSGEGYAQVVLTVQGQPGTNYIATSSHEAVYNIVDPPEGPHGIIYFEDPYNFQYFEGEGIQTYPGYYEWYGPGPEIQTRRHAVIVGDTSRATAIAPEITLAFTGSKNSQDGLSFMLESGECSESLGPTTCAQWWYWNLEGSAVVTDDASKWTVQQTATTPISESGDTIDKSGNLHPFAFQSGGGPDGPNPEFLQTKSGTKTLFWIDAPGALYFGPDGNDIYDLNWDQDYSVKVCSTIVPSICGTASWYVKLRVTAGGILSPTSLAGYGNP